MKMEMTQDGKSQGWEGGLTPADGMAFSLSGASPLPDPEVIDRSFILSL
jgi:hypothetical protein